MNTLLFPQLPLLLPFFHGPFFFSGTYSGSGCCFFFGFFSGTGAGSGSGCFFRFFGFFGTSSGSTTGLIHVMNLSPGIMLTQCTVFTSFSPAPHVCRSTGSLGAGSFGRGKREREGERERERARKEMVMAELGHNSHSRQDLDSRSVGASQISGFRLEHFENRPHTHNRNRKQRTATESCSKLVSTSPSKP